MKNSTSRARFFLFRVEDGVWETNQAAFHVHLSCTQSIPALRETLSRNNDPDFQDTFSLVSV